ncbi:hypothetical protein BCR34DRAFT_584315 [Clohesyomyces aquaticus]|uniref:Uncharacterized protein n=1 Tax=Clohesyomyces aquaticus TaxID=1231657 RepID=A0A1Y2A1J9_9PLEO|nr:hypothetical protein BCR34DRAFT_584315 [Clohesyomyces aquaticus]
MVPSSWVAGGLSLTGTLAPQLDARSLTNTTRFNQTISNVFNNFTSPYFTGAVTTATKNPSHNSTIAVVYAASTVPTPWPLIVASIGYSVITALWTLIGMLRPQKPSSSGKTLIGGLFFTTTNTVRSTSVLISTCKALLKPTVEGTGRFMPPSAIGALTLSIIPYIFRSPPPFDAVATIDTMMAFASLIMMTFWPLSKPGLLSYGKKVMVGGNCPIAVTDCYGWPTLFERRAGCGWYNTSDPTYKFDETTMLSTAEHMIGIFMFAPLILLGGWFCIFLGAVLVVMLGSAFTNIVKWLRRPNWDVPEMSRSKRRWVIAICALKILFLVVIGVVSFALHRATEVPTSYSNGEKGGQAFYFVDSFGPVRNLSAELAGESWSECFKVYLPTDSQGFLGAWWLEHKYRPETWLGLV